MRFICDDNLGKLARYLRILGFDTLFLEPISDPELLRLAAADKRYLLTRDHQLLEHTHPYSILVLEDDDPLMQLAEVLRSLMLVVEPSLLFQRCSRCNEITLAVDKTQEENHIFPYIMKTQDEISKCPSCGRYYWKGTHYKRMIRELRKAIPNSAIARPWPEE
jgi:uncharacterized protein